MQQCMQQYMQQYMQLADCWVVNAVQRRLLGMVGVVLLVGCCVAESGASELVKGTHLQAPALMTRQAYSSA